MEIKMPHGGHQHHLCYLHNVGFVKAELEDYKKLVTNAKFVCKSCGRAAESDKSLCAPEKLK